MARNIWNKIINHIIWIHICVLNNINDFPGGLDGKVSAYNVGENVIKCTD